MADKNKIKISKERLEHLEYDLDTQALTIQWWVGGQENAIYKLVVKAELIETFKTGKSFNFIAPEPNE
jgi:hypothetical protein